jgi:hypothetical protein
MQILQHIIVIMLDINLWTGRKKLRAEDLAVNGIDIDRLPPGTLASLGSKRIIGAEALAPFLAIKRESEKICLGKGVRFLSGFAIPVAAADEVTASLEQLKVRFGKAKADFLRTYEQSVEDWARENPPEWAPVIRAAVDPVSYVAKTLQFRFTPIAVSAPEDLESTGLTEQTTGLFSQLCHEVRISARAAFEASFAGKRSVTRKALRPIQAIREKLAGLSFLDPLVVETIEAIDATLDRVPDKGPITGVELNMLAGLLGRQLAQLGNEQQSAGEEDQDVSDPAFKVNGEEDTELTAFDVRHLPKHQTVSVPLAWDF